MLSLTVQTRHHGEVVLEFEHSLLSLSKWEDKTGKPFLSTAQKTPEEMLDYWRLMLTSPEQDPDLVYALSPEQQEEITAYINSTPGATEPPPKVKTQGRNVGEVLTAEIIYMQMTILKIPWEAKHWHVNKLLLTIAWVAYKQTPEKEREKKSIKERYNDWAALNEANRKFFKSNG